MLGTESTSIVSAYELFQLDNRARRFTRSTLDYYRSRLLPFATFCRDQNVVHVGEVSAAVIRAYLVAMQERGLSDHSVHGAARAIKTFCNFLVREDLLPESPMRRVTMPRMDKRILPALSVDDVRALLHACITERDAAIVLFLLDTGVRATELVQLNGADVNIRTGVAQVRLGKGRKDRVVYFGAQTGKQLMRYYISVGTPRPDEGVFRNERNGNRLGTSGLRRALSRLGRQASVEHCSPHTFRRTFAVWSLRAGMPLPHLQHIMGHADITTTQRYLRLIDADLKAAHEEHGAVDKFL